MRFQAATKPKEIVLSPIPVLQQQEGICNDRHYLLRLHILGETLDKSIFTRRAVPEKILGFSLLRYRMDWNGLKRIGTDQDGSESEKIGMDCERWG